MNDHWHYASDIHGGAEEHHRHFDLEREDERLKTLLDQWQADLRELRENLRGALERIRVLEDRIPDGRGDQDAGPEDESWRSTLADYHVASGGAEYAGEPPFATVPRLPRLRPQPEPPGDGDLRLWPEDWVDDAGTGRTYTHPDVLTVGVADGWAEAETDPARIDWPARQARAAIPFEVVNGRPVNPCEKTAIRHGRNEMGFWGEQLMADALVTVTAGGTRHLLMIERGDGYGWAVPGGHVEPGETGLQAAVRELAEETGLDARGWPFTVFGEMPPRYVPDPRSSDEAWAVTIPVRIDLGERDAIPVAVAADDARRAEWIPAGSYSQLSDFLGAYFGGRVFAAHVAMLGEFLGGEPGAEAPGTESARTAEEIADE